MLHKHSDDSTYSCTVHHFPLHFPWSKRREVLKEKRKLGVKQEETSIEENDACRNKISAVGYMLVKKIRTGHEIKELTFLTHPSPTALAYTAFDSVCNTVL